MEESKGYDPEKEEDVQIKEETKEADAIRNSFVVRVAAIQYQSELHSKHPESEKDFPGLLKHLRTVEIVPDSEIPGVNNPNQITLSLYKQLYLPQGWTEKKDK